MCLREEAAVEEADRRDRRAALAARDARFVASEELLRDRVAVVVREDVKALDAEGPEEPLVQRRLIEDRVVVRARLVGVAEADHVGGDHAEASGEPRPDRRPVPRRAREAVDRQERGAFALGPVRDRVSPMPVGARRRPPLLERRCRCALAHGSLSLMARSPREPSRASTRDTRTPRRGRSRRQCRR